MEMKSGQLCIQTPLLRASVTSTERASGAEWRAQEHWRSRFAGLRLKPVSRV